jgi:iron complex transport system ATP-binding protein
VVPVISVKGLEFSYQKGKPVIRGVDLAVKNGEFLGICGPNGCGKSTLLKCLDRTLDVSKGRVMLSGTDIRKMKRRDVARTISVVPQESNFGFDFTALEVVSMGRYPHLGLFEFEDPKSREIIKRSMEYTKTWQLRDRPITVLSGGEKQRVMIAQALAQEPRILMLDEPTKDLDIRHSLDILELIKKKNRREGLTVIGVFHDLNMCARFCDSVVLMKKGRIVARGPVGEVLSERNIKKVFGVTTRVKRGKTTVVEIIK